MFGIKYQIFSRSKTRLDFVVHRLRRFDSRTGMLSAGLPLTVIMTALIGVSTIIIDKQFEMRTTRGKTVTDREMQNEREDRMMEAVLAKSDEEYVNRPTPK